MTGTSAVDRTDGERSVVVTVDQVISSATNFLVVLAASRLFGASDFGAFAVALSAAGIGLGVVRATSSERLLLEGAVRSEKSALAPVSLLIVMVAVEIVVLAVWLLTSSEGAVMWLLATPAILLQDRLRYVSLSLRPLSAVASDGAWLATAVAGWFAGTLGGLEPVAAMGIVLLVGPALGLIVLGVGLSADVGLRISQDVRDTAQESRFVLDSWVLSSAVFIALSGIAAVESLQVAGQFRLLFLIFQPFFSLAYVGRWVVLQARPEVRLERWPVIITLGSAGYGLVAIVVFGLLDRLDLLPVIWQIGIVALSLNVIGQVARAYHQGVADLLRRTGQPGLVRARVIFAFVLVLTGPALAGLWGLRGAALAVAVAFASGALSIAGSSTSASAGSVGSSCDWSG